MQSVYTPMEWKPTSTTLYKRQSSGSTTNTSTSVSPSSTEGSGSTGNSNNQGAPPLSVFTFIIAIALFVLVVTFVLLRIFVRNRRLRRLGLYPESPIERLLGGPIREYEDTLPPPKIWDAKIADVGANNQGAMTRAESAWLSGGVNSGDGKDHGWETLMPVAAALPPSLYPVIFAQDASNSSNAVPSSATNANGAVPAQSTASRIGVRMPNFLRRSTNEPAIDAVDANSNTEGNVTNQTNDANKSNPTGPEKEQITSINKDETLAASVNITVLIAMPSPSTVFPIPQKGLRHSTSKLDSPPKLPEVEEDADPDASSDKGKARKAPSLRSVRSTATIKSLSEARREAFFNGNSVSHDQQQQQAKNSAPPLEATKSFYDDDEEALPELVFGTASVPLYSKIISQKHVVGSSPSLVPPTRDEIMGLMATVSEARSRKIQPTKAKSDQKSDDAEANRRSVAGTSLEGGMSNLEEQQGLGDVVTRMMRNQNGVRDQNESYELGTLSNTAELRSSSTTGGPSIRPDLQPHTSTATQKGLMNDAASMGLDEQSTPLATPLTINELEPLRLATTPSLQTPGIAMDLPPLSTSGSTTSIFTDAHEPQSATATSIRTSGRDSAQSFHSTR